MFDNPAGRLHDILSRVLNYHAGNAPMKDVWRQVLDIRENDDTELASIVLSRVSEIMQLIVDCKKLIAQHPEIAQSLHLEPFQVAGNALSYLNLEEPWERFTGRLATETVSAMRYTSDYLSRDHAEEVVEPETLMEFQAHVSDLLEQIVESDVPDELKTFLIDALEEMDRAIRGYRISGAEGLRRALDSSVGAALRFHEELVKTQEESPTEVIPRFFYVLNMLDRIVGQALNIKQLASGITQFIPLGGSGS